MKIQQFASNTKTMETEFEIKLHKALKLVFFSIRHFWGQREEKKESIILNRLEIFLDCLQ